MVSIAILGNGTVGSGIRKVLEQNKSHIEKKAGCVVTVKKVLDVRDFPANDPVTPLLTHDYNDILNDGDIQIVAEVIGGLEPAYTFVKQALQRGKHVCTSNKELVAEHGAELLALARERNINFLFEASVGGGIPIVRPMNLALTTDAVAGIAGILNGTSNYILTHMNAFGKSFAEALAEAQTLGYAESNPAADVEGYDACRKLAILLSLATGYQVNFNEIQTEGITRLDKADFAFARFLGYNIKLLVDGRITESGVEALTAPMLVHHQHPLANVTDVFNGVLVQGKVTGDIMFIGRGAGQLPTAGAVASDIVDIAKHLHTHIRHNWLEQRIAVQPLSGYIKKRMVRIKCDKKEPAAAAVRELYTSAELFGLPEYPGQLAFIAPFETEAAHNEKRKQLSLTAPVLSSLRVYEPVIIYDTY